MRRCKRVSIEVPLDTKVGRELRRLLGLAIPRGAMEDTLRVEASLTWLGNRRPEESRAFVDE